MSERRDESAPLDAADEQAIEWIWRISRGLTPAEQDELFAWMAARPENATALARARRDWERLDRLAEWRPEHSLKPNPDLLAPSVAEPAPARFRPWMLAAACLAVAAIVGGTAWWRTASDQPGGPGATATARAENRHLLPDGSVVKLNDGASFEQYYSAEERRLKLVRGEAFFIVAKDAGRPFVVEAGGARVRAVGTAFNVRLAPDQVDVLVAEGLVEVEPAPAAVDGVAGPRRARPALLEERQRVTLPAGPERLAITIATVTRQELQSALSWQHGLMTFQEKSLAEIAAELNRLNDTQILLADGEIAQMKFSGTIYSDNLEGFARLLETGFGAGVRRTPDGHLELRTVGSEK